MPDTSAIDIGSMPRVGRAPISCGTGARQVTPTLRPEDRGMRLLPWIDPENFNPGYLMRGMHLLPKRGDKPEWQHTQDYWSEKDEFPDIDLNDPLFAYA